MARGVPLSREINDLLQRSFEYDGAPGRRNRLAQGILRVMAEAMDAAGESALFTKHQRWDVARQQNWVNDPDAYELATGAAAQILTAFKPPGKKVAKPTSWDARHWAEFILKQAATGEPNTDAPEARMLAQQLRAMIGDDLAARIEANRRRS